MLINQSLRKQNQLQKTEGSGRSEISRFRRPLRTVRTTFTVQRLKQFVGDVPFDDRFRGLRPDYLQYIEVFPGPGDVALSPPHYPVPLYRIRINLFAFATTLL